MRPEEIDSLISKCKNLQELITIGMPISSASVAVVLEYTLELAAFYKRENPAGNVPSDQEDPPRVQSRS